MLSRSDLGPSLLLDFGGPADMALKPLPDERMELLEDILIFFRHGPLGKRLPHKGELSFIEEKTEESIRLRYWHPARVCIFPVKVQFTCAPCKTLCFYGDGIPSSNLQTPEEKDALRVRTHGIRLPVVQALHCNGGPLYRMSRLLARYCPFELGGVGRVVDGRPGHELRLQRLRVPLPNSL